MAIRVPRALVALVACWLAAAIAGCSPFGGGAFACQDDTQCGAGQCKAGYCAFPDDTCSSHLRYGGLSGPVANTCYAGDSDSADAGVTGSDAAPDASPAVDAAPGDTCLGTHFVQVCFAPTQLPPMSRALGTATINTDDAGSCDAVDGPAPGCVIAAQALTVMPGAVVRATGSRPLVLVGTSSIEIDGKIDVSSTRSPASNGAASDPMACVAGTPPTGNGGGAGGSFGAMGAPGGTSDATGSTGGAPGAAAAGAELMQLRGGCPGQDGVSGGTKASGGSGGGAVYLLAGMAIAVNGTIDASGAGSTVGTIPDAGGGGGGAGGMIGLEAPTLTVAAAASVYANGGGGSSGTGGSTAGSSGADPASATMPAPGGNGPTTNGGPGGNGATTMPAKPGGPGKNSGGGGGGGGGAGVVDAFGTLTNQGAISPAPSST